LNNSSAGDLFFLWRKMHHPAAIVEIIDDFNFEGFSSGGDR
jgi:hypothetical protein